MRTNIGRSKVGEGKVCTPPGIQILSILCRYRGNLAKSCVGDPVGLAPPRENPGFATDNI